MQVTLWTRVHSPSVPRSEDYLLDAASRYPLLTAEEEIQLGRAIRAWQDWEGGADQAPAAIKRRGQRALDRFICSNIKLGYRVARKFRNAGVPLEDLTQAALEGLREAYLRFQPRLGYRSSSYAVWWALRACQRLIAEQAQVIHLPVALAGEIRRLHRAQSEFHAANGRQPSHHELEQELGLSAGGVSRLQLSLRMASTCSLDSPPPGSQHGDGQQDSSNLIDYLHASGHTTAPLHDPLEQLIADDHASQLREALQRSAALSPQQRYILRQRYLQEKPTTHARLAADLNLHRNRVRQLEQTAIEVLRQELAGLQWQAA